MRPYRTAIVLLGSIRQLWPGSSADPDSGENDGGLQWPPPPYEYEDVILPIDILSGGCELRERLQEGLTPADLEGLTALDEETWWSEVEPFLLY